MVGLQILALPIGVRLPGPEPRKMALAIESVTCLPAGRRGPDFSRGLRDTMRVIKRKAPYRG